ncbi:MAG: hypothetical protein R2725_11830 [Solirubrobacterales bacterium]
MSKSNQEFAEAKVRAHIVSEPEARRTTAGTWVCRLMVERAVGPASRPVRIALYVKGEIAKRCGFNLFRGDLIEAWGEIGPMRDGIGHQEILVADGAVKLRERGRRAAA